LNKVLVLPLDSPIKPKTMQHEIELEHFDFFIDNLGSGSFTKSTFIIMEVIQHSYMEVKVYPLNITLFTTFFT